MFLRISAFYFFGFAVVGVHLPFWPLFLDFRGLDADEIGLALGGAQAARVAATPFLGALSDRWGRRKTLLILVCLVTVPAFGLFAIIDQFWLIFIANVLTGLIFAGLFTLTDNLAMLAAEHHGLNYARARLAGSASFILANLLSGWLLSRLSPDWVLYQLLLWAGLSLIAAFLLPDIRTAPTKHEGGNIRLFLKQPIFLAVGGAVALSQAAHGAYYGFGTLHWQRLGLSEDIIALLWAEGVICEMALFWYGRSLSSRLGAMGMIGIGSILAMVRWLGTYMADANLWWLVPLQSLHAASFGLTYLGLIAFLGRAIPPERSATAQGLLSGTMIGSAMAASMYLTGVFFDRLGGAVFLLMALLALVGAIFSFRIGRIWKGQRLDF